MIPLRKKRREDNDGDYLCTCCAKFVFNWNRRRSGWRLSVFFKSVAATTLTGNVITLGMYLLITSRDFFKNYRCGETAIRFITMNFLALMAFTGSAGVAAVMMSRVLLLFNRFPISEFMALGKWISRLGCIVKWLPAFTVLCFLGWLILGLVSTLWIFCSPEGWCSRRWSYAGIAAVTNCRLWYRGEGKCIDTQEKERIDSTMVSVCNDGLELSDGNFFWFTPKDESASCSLSDITVCKAYKVLFSTLGESSGSSSVDWTSESLSGCRGPEASGEPPEAFMVATGDTSDLYRYLLMYCVTWNIALLTLILFFCHIKYSSKMDSVFHLPSRAKENIVLRFFRVLSPFNR
ncbi:hypothetical protein Esti_005359 [Eimeria stiedai]